MKNSFFYILLTFALLSLTACGGKKGETEQTSLDSSNVNAPAGEPYADSPMARTDTVALGGKVYLITVQRKADKSLPTMTDEYGKAYYDNRVDVKIAAASGETVFEKSYTKDTFGDYLTAAESRDNLLLGMAYDPTKSDAHAVYLGAQMGQIGIGDGPAFCIEIPLDGAAPHIIRDKNQDTTGDDGLGD